MKKDEEKVLMEVTKSEAMFVLFDRLENKWYVDLEPVIIFLPGVALSYFIYLYVEGIANTWFGLVAVAPIACLCFYLLIRQMKKRRIKAQGLYEKMKSGK